MKVSLLQIIKEGEQAYLASYSNFQIYSYGRTVQEAILRLKEIIKFYTETAKELNISLEEICDVHQEGMFLPLDRHSLDEERWIKIEVRNNFH